MTPARVHWSMRVHRKASFNMWAKTEPAAQHLGTEGEVISCLCSDARQTGWKQCWMKTVSAPSFLKMKQTKKYKWHSNTKCALVSPKRGICNILYHAEPSVLCASSHHPNIVFYCHLVSITRTTTLSSTVLYKQELKQTDTLECNCQVNLNKAVSYFLHFLCALHCGKVV